MKYENMFQCINNAEITYRSILTIPRDVSFGLEIEMENVDCEVVSGLVKSQFGSMYTVKIDRSLKKDMNAEIALPPLYNNRKTWVILKKLGELLQRLNPTFENCSLQVNFDSSLLPTYKDKLKFLKLFAVYEDIVYRFSKGDDSELRDSIGMYAYPIILSLKTFKDWDVFALEPYSNQKMNGICFKNGDRNLIEFRTPNGTINPILWQNYITFFYYLLLYSIRCNENELDEYIDTFNKTYIFEYYMKRHDEKAFDLARKIFKKSTDQIYFLQQYTKK